MVVEKSNIGVCISTMDKVCYTEMKELNDNSAANMCDEDLRSLLGYKTPSTETVPCDGACKKARKSSSAHLNNDDYNKEHLTNVTEDNGAENYETYQPKGDAKDYFKNRYFAEDKFTEKLGNALWSCQNDYCGECDNESESTCYSSSNIITASVLATIGMLFAL